MSDNVHHLVAFAAIAIPPIAIAVVYYASLPRHPPQDIRAGRRNPFVAAVPPFGTGLEQPNPQPTHAPQANHHVHPEDPVAVLAPPSPPPNYLEYRLDTRIDGPVPGYSSGGSSRGGTVHVVPFQNQNPPLENVNLD